MNDLDSRFLRLGDCFVQRFAKPGTFNYMLSPVGGSSPPLGRDSYAIRVQPDKGNTSSQRNVVVRHRGGTLLPEPAELAIHCGDTVLWHTLEAATPGFAVVGQGESGSFSSAALSVEAIFSHAFGSPGSFEWVDANGGGACGEIEVHAFDPRQHKDYKKWLAALAKGTLIKVTGDKASPARVQILVGQRVFWLVNNASGITVTDARLLRPSPANKFKNISSSRETQRDGFGRRGRAGSST